MNIDNNSMSFINPDTDRSMPGVDQPVQSDQLNIGDSVVNNRYKVHSVLGKGGMGIVYKCWDDVSNVEVALKTIAPELSGSAWEMDRIKENFKLVHNLHHPNIAAYNTLERDNTDGMYYLVMEYVDGEDLRYYLRDMREKNDFSEEKVINIIRQVADALDYAHAQQILHRDIKPGNIMISRKNEVKILDFGLAAQIHSSLSKVSMQKIDTSGTLPYIAPEQWRGYQAEAASDQYALAATVYEIFSGHPPFETADKDIMRTCVINDPPQPLKNVSENIQTAVAKALAKKPEERFESCKEFANALNGIASDVQPGMNSSRSSSHGSLSTDERKEFYLLRSNTQKMLQQFKEQHPDQKKISPQIKEVLKQTEELLHGTMNKRTLLLLKDGSLQQVLQEYSVLTQKQAETHQIISDLQKSKIAIPTDLQELYTIAEQAYQDDDIAVAADFYNQLTSQLKDICKAAEQKRNEQLAAEQKRKEQLAAEKSIKRQQNKLQMSICQDLLRDLEALESDCKRLGIKMSQHTCNQKAKAVNAQTIENYADAIKFYKAAIDSINDQISKHTAKEQDRRKAEKSNRDLQSIKKQIKTLEQKYSKRTVGYNYTIEQAQKAEAAGNISKAVELYKEASVLILKQDKAQTDTPISTPPDPPSMQNNIQWERIKSTAQQGLQAANGFISNVKDSVNSHQVNNNDIQVLNFLSRVRLPGNLPLPMVAIKSGSFYMGSPVSGFFQQEELGRWEDEERRRIIITQPFCIGCYPITQRQFQAVTGNNPSHFRGLDLPVENVSLYDAYFFCNKLNDIFKNALPRGWYFTLPNEVQWEYACRAGTLTALNNGKNLTREENFCPCLNEVAWYKANSQNTTHPVGCKAPNAWGIYDMHGNIWEWTTSKPDPQIEKYIIRGGSWFHDARYCRSAARHTVNATSKGDDIGFRIILTK